MDDEKLLSEALRAHAAGGVSMPNAQPAPQSSPQPSSPSSLQPSPPPRGPSEQASSSPAEATATGSSRWTGRFRPATEPSPVARTTQHAPGPHAPGTPPPGMPRPAGPRPPTPPRGWAGAPPMAPGAAMPGPRPGPPGVPYPRVGGPPAPHAAPMPPPAQTHGEPRHPEPWSARRVAWWSGVALLGGAVAGALGAVVTLLAP